MNFRELMLEQKQLILDKSVLDNFPTRRNTSEEVPRFLTKFTLPKDYKGDFGFDKWSSEFLLNDQIRNIETSFSLMKYGDELILPETYKKIKKGDKRPPHYESYPHNAAFLCIRNGQKADINLELLTLDNKSVDFNIDDFLYFEGVNSDYINIKVNNVPLLQEVIPVKGANTVHYLRVMKCNKSIATITIELVYNNGNYIDANTRMAIYYKKKNESYDKLRQIGEIVLCPNKPINIPVRVLVYKKDIENYCYSANGFPSPYDKEVNTIKSELEKHLNTKSISNACINFSVTFLNVKPDLGSEYNNYVHEGKFVKDIELLSQNINEALQTFDEFENLVNLNGDVITFKSLDLKLLDVYKKTALSRDVTPFKGITIFLTPFLGDKKEQDGGFVRGTCKEMIHAIIYVQKIFKTKRPLLDIEHEVGHILGLLHTFLKGSSLKTLIEEKDKLDKEIKNEKVEVDKKNEKNEKSDADKLEIVKHRIKSRSLKNRETNLESFDLQKLFFKKHLTNNIMDYGEDSLNKLLNPTTFFWQWKIMREKAMQILDKKY
jgi:hypothetical protein